MENKIALQGRTFYFCGGSQNKWMNRYGLLPESPVLKAVFLSQEVSSSNQIWPKKVKCMTPMATLGSCSSQIWGHCPHFTWRHYELTCCFFSHFETFMSLFCFFLFEEAFFWPRLIKRWFFLKIDVFFQKRDRLFFKVVSSVYKQLF